MPFPPFIWMLLTEMREHSTQTDLMHSKGDSWAHATGRSEVRQAVGSADPGPTNGCPDFFLVVHSSIHKT